MIRALFALLLCSVAACAEPVALGCTASVSASGLLAELLPAFTQKTGLAVTVVTAEGDAVVALGRDGKADLLIASAPSAERALLASGKAASLQKLMTAKSGDAFDVLLMRLPPAEDQRARAADKLATWLRGADAQGRIAAFHGGAYLGYKATAPTMSCPAVKR